MNHPIRVLIVARNHLFRQATRRLLDSAAGMATVGEAEAGQQALDLVHELQPHVVLWSIDTLRSPAEVQEDLETMARISELYPHSKTILLCSDGQEREALEALRNGAQGCLVRERGRSGEPTRPVGIVRAIHTVSQGGTVLTPRMAGWLMDEMSGIRKRKRPMKHSHWQSNHANYQRANSEKECIR